VLARRREGKEKEKEDTVGYKRDEIIRMGKRKRKEESAEGKINGKEGGGG
jgi:hypothetical protein